MDGIEDDDFGELYADVELQASSGVGAVTAFGQVPPTSAGELVSAGAKSSVSSPGESTQSDDGDDCESEDDLNILLNDDDCKVVPRKGAGGGLADEDNGVNGDDNDAFKVLSGPALHSKTSGVSSQDIGDDYNKDVSYTSRVCAPISSFAPQSGYIVSLPRYSSIFHVNVDAFKEKPWRHPGADVTDFFNFGLDEESWKSYCKSLELLRQQTCLHTRILDFKSLKHSKVFENGMNHDKFVQGDTVGGITQTSMQGIVSNSEEFLESEASKFTKQGRAIEVEVSIGERLPSTIIRRARSPDSDVVIEIPLQDCPKEFSCSGNTVVECLQDSALESSENGDADAEERAIPQDCLEGKAKRLKELSNPERYSRKIIVSKLNSTDDDKHNISNLDDDHGGISLENPKGEVKTPESVNIKGGVHGGRSVADLWLMENEAFPVESTKLTLASSFFESDFEASNDCVSVDHGNDHISNIRSLQNDQSEYSLASHCKNSANYHAKRARRGNYPRQRTLNQEEKYHNRRTRNSFKKVMDDGAASLTSDYGHLSDSEYWQIDCNRWSERQFFIERYNDELSSYYTRKKVRDGETLTDNILDVCRGFSNRKGERILRDAMDSRTGEHLNEHEIFSCRRCSTDEENWERDCYLQLQRKDADRRDSFTYRDSIHDTLQHCSDTSTEADSLRRTNSEDIRLKGEHSEHGRYGYDNNVMQYKYRRHSPMDSNRGSLERNYKRKVSTSTKVNRSGKRDAYEGGSPSIEDGSWYKNFEDGYPDFTDWDSFLYQPLRGAHTIERKWLDPMLPRDGSYDSQLSRRRHKRPCYVDESRDSGSPGAYNEVDGNGHFHFPKDQGRLRKTRSNSKSDVQHLTKDESFAGHQDDELRIEEASVFYRRNSRGGTNQFKNFSSEEIIEKNMLAKQDLHKMMREQSGAFNVNRGFHVPGKIKSDQAIPNSRVSVDIFFREGKLSRSNKGQKIMSHATPEDEDLRVVKRETFDSLKTEIHQEDDDRKWIDKFPTAEGNEYSEEIEEGQIVLEEPAADPEPTKKKVPGSQRTAKKNERSDGFDDKRLSAKKNEGSDGFDDKRLLETLAKMQRRKERFKVPITQLKEAEGKTGSQLDTKAETAETRAARPARKRRWGGV